MSERKVLNKYYPPDFDPSKIPRMKLAKNRQYTVRLMAPFNMRCVTCGEYIYKGKKFNARKEDVENESYLGIRIYRFYIKCTRCLQEISFKTDPRNTDYEIEAGATRNFMALKLAEEQARKEEEELREEEASNPMKLLENRTEQSRNEIELLESLEELRDLNRRQQNIDYDTMLQQYDNTETVRQREERLAQLDEDYIKTIKFETKAPQINTTNKRVAVEEIIEMGDDFDSSKMKKPNPPPSQKLKLSSNLSSGRFSIGSRLNKNLGAIVKKKIVTTKSHDNKIFINDKPSDNKTKPNQVPELNVRVKETNQDLANRTTIEEDKPKAGGSLALLGMYSDDDSSD